MVMNLSNLMKPCLNAWLLIVFVTALPALAQQNLYPVRGKAEVSVLINADRTAFVVEKSFQHKLILGVPEDDRMALLPDTRASLAVFWLRIQNTSQRPLKLDLSTFSSTDEEGAKFAALAPEAALMKMMTDSSGGSIGTKTLRGLSLGAVGGNRTEEVIKEDVLRYSLASGEIAGGGIKEGFIYFEAPNRKDFRMNVTLGDLWGRPLLFSTDKQN
jgi:hypothetical protein